MTIQQAFDLAVQHHESGRLADAEAIYRQILAVEPRHAEALHGVGVIAYQVGRNDVAADSIRQAIALRPNFSAAYDNLGTVLRAQGLLDAAIAAHRQALAITPHDPEAYYNLANALHDQRQLDEAIAAYRQAVALKPDFAEAHSNLGNALRSAGQFADAIAACREAVRLRPDYAEAHSNLGNAFHESGQLDEAIEANRQAIALRPHYPEAFSNLGAALRDKGQLDEAIAACRQAVALKPNYPEAHFNLGAALSSDRRDIDGAIVAFRRAIADRPFYPEAHNNLGYVLYEKGQLPEAIAACRQALALRPVFPEAHCNLGMALQASGHLDEAIAAYRRAVALQPNFPEAESNLGSALREKGNLVEGIAVLRQAVAHRPDFHDAYNNLGIALQANGQLDEAIAAYRQAITPKPDYAEAYSNLGAALGEKAQHDEVITLFRQALALKPELVSAHSNLLLTLNYQSGLEARAVAEEHRCWNRLHAEPLRALIQPHRNDRNPSRRLRIGYVSPDFREHPVGQFLLPLLGQHDHRNFEIFCYAQVTAPDVQTDRLRTYADHWHSLTGLFDPQAAELIREHRIDILVDLSGHTSHHRLLIFAHQPAPVQVTYLGYPNTTGLATMDYRLTDEFADPPGLTESLHSEQLIRLSPCAWCYLPAASPPVAARSDGPVTFGCFNNFAKTTEPMLALWGRILASVPESRLLLKARALSSESTRDQVRQSLGRAGIGPERLELRGLEPGYDAHLGLYHRIDVALDTFPYHGTTTTCEALWMGVPVVTLAGQTHASRVGLSLLNNVGLPELVATSEEQYLQLAVSLATDLPRLAALRSTLRERMKNSALMDAPRFARNVEAAYRQMWRSWCANQSSTARE